MLFDPTYAVPVVAIVATILLLVAVVPPWLGHRSPLLPAALRRGRPADRMDDWSTRLSTGPAVLARLAELRDLEDRQARADAARDAYGGRDSASGEPGQEPARDSGRDLLGREQAMRETRDLATSREPAREPAREPGRPAESRAASLPAAGREPGREPVRAERDAGVRRPAIGPDPDLNPLAIDSATRLGQPGDAPAADDARNSAAYDRIVRVVAMVFILAALTVVTVSGVWPEAQGGVTLLLVVAALVVLVVHDVLPASVARTVIFAIEGLVAVGLTAALVAVTGRQASPFFPVFLLIVSGAALVISARATFVLATLAIAGYIAAVAVGDGTSLVAATVSTISINVTALLLLTYVSMAIARMQRRSRDAAIRMSTIDAMTGLYNRPFLFSSIEQEIARSTRTGRGFCLLMMDLDELKPINDRYGHFVGDRALRAVSDVIKFGVRRIDIPARYGGDEFVVLLPETDPTGGYVLGEKIRQGVSELVVPGTEVRTSMSVGMVAYPEDGRTADELMISADRAMYASKRLGKNRVMGAPSAAGGRADSPV